MITRALFRGLISLVRSVFGWLPNGPALDLTGFGPYQIPAPSWLGTAANTAVRTPLGLLMAMVAFGLAYGLFRRVAELVLGKRGESL